MGEFESQTLSLARRLEHLWLEHRASGRVLVGKGVAYADVI